MKVEKIREKIPALKHCIHLDSAAISPLFGETLTEIQNFFEYRGNKPLSTDFVEILKEQEECRKRVAELVNASASEIAFMQNTSEGISTVAQMIDWEKDDNLVITDLEFPSNSIPWYNLRKKGVEVRTVKNVKGEIRIEDMEKMMDENTRLVAISHVQFGNGFRIDLEEVSKLCSEQGAFFFSDVIQGVGAVSLDVKKANLDFFSSAVLKWLMGPVGVGIFYIRKKLIDEFEPPYTGWFSLKNLEDSFVPGLEEIEFADTAQKFETGGRSFPLIIGLKKSLEIFLDIGMDFIEKRVLHLSEYVLENAENTQTPRDESKRAGIVNVKHRDPAGIVKRLREKKIICSSRMNGVRISTHFWNTAEDVDEALKVIKR